MIAQNEVYQDWIFLKDGKYSCEIRQLLLRVRYPVECAKGLESCSLGLHMGTIYSRQRGWKAG